MKQTYSIYTCTTCALSLLHVGAYASCLLDVCLSCKRGITDSKPTDTEDHHCLFITRFHTGALHNVSRFTQFLLELHC